MHAERRRRREPALGMYGPQYVHEFLEASTKVGKDTPQSAQRPQRGRAAIQIRDSKFKTKQKEWFLTGIFAGCEETHRTETTLRQSRSSNSRFKIQDKAKRLVSDGNFCALRRNSAHRDHSAAEPQFKFKIQKSRQSKKNGF